MPDATPSTARRVTTEEDIQDLAREILDPSRTLPVIAVTTKPSEDGPFVDADALATRLGESAEVWVIRNADHAWALTEELPDKIDVYGGAVRAWTPIAEGNDSPYPSDHPQWTVYGRDENQKTIDLIAGWIGMTAENPLPAFGEVTTATVTVVRKQGAELLLATGHPGFASIGHLIQHGEVFHTADVLQKGQEVKVRIGAWNPSAGRLSVTLREFAPDPWERLAEVYEPGMFVEAGVSGITQFGAFVELLPGVEGLLHKSKIADEFVEYVEDFVQEGDRITVRLLDIDVRGRKAPVSLRDVPRGAEPETPASIFPGGPPWLPSPEAIAADIAEHEALTAAKAQAGSEWSDVTGKPSEWTDTSSGAAPAQAAAWADGGAGPGLAASGSAANGSANGSVSAAAAANAPAYAPQLQALVGQIVEHGGGDSEFASMLCDALEVSILTLSAQLDESDDSSDEPAEPLATLLATTDDLIDALREAGEQLEWEDITDAEESGDSADESGVAADESDAPEAVDAPAAAEAAAEVEAPAEAAAEAEAPAEAADEPAEPAAESEPADEPEPVDESEAVADTAEESIEVAEEPADSPEPSGPTALAQPTALEESTEDAAAAEAAESTDEVPPSESPAPVEQTPLFDDAPSTDDE